MEGPRLEVVVGCMFAGKSTELLRRGRRAAVALGSEAVLYIKHPLDARYNTSAVIVTHDRRQQSALLTDRLATVSLGAAVRVVVVDELQFYAPDDFKAFYCEVVARRKLVLICGGLLTTNRGTAWPTTLAALERADATEQLTAVCVRCRRNATCSVRRPDGDGGSRDDSGPVRVGAADRYWAACRRCWLQCPEGVAPVEQP